MRLQKVLDWINELKLSLEDKEIETEEINIIDISMSDNPSVTVHHFNPNKSLGQITVWESSAGFAEVIDFDTSETLYTEHFQLSNDDNLNAALEKYLKVLDRTK
jgi:short-subunit dehydrogenase